jgi:hypothetical protein
MTKLERIARDLAAVLSPQGEADWRRFVGMAEDVGTRLYEQLSIAFPANPSRSSGANARGNSAGPAGL